MHQVVQIAPNRREEQRRTKCGGDMGRLWRTSHLQTALLLMPRTDGKFKTIAPPQDRVAYSVHHQRFSVVQLVDLVYFAAKIECNDSRPRDEQNTRELAIVTP
jgi:hypothetical protein